MTNVVMETLEYLFAVGRWYDDLNIMNGKAEQPRLPDNKLLGISLHARLPSLIQPKPQLFLAVKT